MTNINALLIYNVSMFIFHWCHVVVVVAAALVVVFAAAAALVVVIVVVVVAAALHAISLWLDWLVI